jgi:hypothetical protein
MCQYVYPSGEMGDNSIESRWYYLKLNMLTGEVSVCQCAYLGGKVWVDYIESVRYHFMLKR